MKSNHKIKKNKLKLKRDSHKKISIFELQNSPKYMNFRAKI